MAVRRTRAIDIAKALADKRDELRLSKSKACIELGVSRMTYDMWERDSWVPAIDRYKDIANFIDQDPKLVLRELMMMNGIPASDLPGE